jgi:hypothetical protein
LILMYWPSPKARTGLTGDLYISAKSQSRIRTGSFDMTRF